MHTGRTDSAINNLAAAMGFLDTTIMKLRAAYSDLHGLPDPVDWPVVSGVREDVEALEIELERVIDRLARSARDLEGV